MNYPGFDLDDVLQECNKQFSAEGLKVKFVRDDKVIVDHQKKSIDAEIAKCIGMNPKAGKAELKKQLVKTLVRSGHTRARAIQLVEENWASDKIKPAIKPSFLFTFYF